ncbi:MAG TPA: hypothetical protein VGM56_01850 [Byssovorax sp.]|jgi:rhombotail lipoprotein
MNARQVLFASVAPVALALAGCAAEAPPMPARAAAAADVVAKPPILERSLYAKDATGALSEHDMQKVLESPIDLVFPARVGVVPLGQAFDASSKASIAIESTASEQFAASLRGNPSFAQVSHISTDLPATAGIEGLRTIAARYRIRYLVLYTERFEDATHLNAWAWTYPTILGMFVTPGVTVASRGLVEADMIDVRTGTVLFSVLEPMEVSEKELMVGAARSHKELQEEAAAKAAKKLAAKVSAQTHALVAAADDAARNGSRATVRILPAPIADRGE